MKLYPFAGNIKPSFGKTSPEISVNSLLLETSGSLLLEDGDDITLLLLES